MSAQPFADTCAFRIDSRRCAADAEDVLINGVIPSWCTVIRDTRPIGLVSHSFGVARVHELRGTTPLTALGAGPLPPPFSSQSGFCETNSQSDELDSRGVTRIPGRRDVPPPQPANKANAPALKPERSNRRREIWSMTQHSTDATTASDPFHRLTNANGTNDA